MKVRLSGGIYFCVAVFLTFTLLCRPSQQQTAQRFSAWTGRDEQEGFDQEVMNTIIQHDAMTKDKTKDTTNNATMQPTMQQDD